MTFVVPGVSPAVAEEWGVGAEVRIATEGAYRPWNFLRPDGTLVGFEIDLVNLLCADLKFQCVIQTEDWARMLPRLEQGKFDAVFAGMSITAARKSKARFSVPYASTPAVFVAAPGQRAPETNLQRLTLPELTEREQEALVELRKAFLNGVVGVQQGTTHEIFLRDYIEGYSAIKTYGRQSSLDEDVKRGRLTAMLVSLGYAAPMTREDQGASLKIVGPRISGGPFGEGIGAAFRKNDGTLATAFSAAIKKRIADGTVRTLSIRWFGFDISAKP